MKRCPKCGGQTFSVIVYVIQEWTVNCDGDWLATQNDCAEVMHRPDDDDIWQCVGCGHDGPGREFNESGE